jgi:hypothetical protein
MPASISPLFPKSRWAKLNPAIMATTTFSWAMVGAVLAVFGEER